MPGRVYSVETADRLFVKLNFSSNKSRRLDQLCHHSLIDFLILAFQSVALRAASRDQRSRFIREEANRNLIMRVPPKNSNRTFNLRTMNGVPKATDCHLDGGVWCLSINPRYRVCAHFVCPRSISALPVSYKRRPIFVIS